MKTSTFIVAALLLAAATVADAKNQKQVWPDGTPMESWFTDTAKVDVSALGRQYVITDYGVKNDSTLLQTEAIQKVIDTAAEAGGGVVVVPRGTFFTGSLFFRPGTHLHLADGSRLKGSDAITHYKIVKTRLEGQTLNYFAALINANGVDGFTITGRGTIDGNGRRFYDEFWLRRKVFPKCTNLEALRPRLVYISDSKNVTVQDVRLVYSGFWTNHLYRCSRVRYLDCYIYAPTSGYPKGPSTDAIDLDACSDVLIRGSYMNVNDDAVCLKGGKGTFVDKDSTNGPVRNVLVEGCRFGKSNSGITFGSEAWDCSNIILRDCSFKDTYNVVLFKMRPDTPQKYGNVLVENCTGTARNGIEVSRWMQFYNLLERPDMPRSRVFNVTVRNIDMQCRNKFCNVQRSDKYDVSDFKFEDITAKDKKGTFDTSFIDGVEVKNVSINGRTW
jgi:polygalacturonase